MENHKWEKRNLVTVDQDTGEIVEGFAVYVGAKVKWPKDKGFFMGIQEAFGALAKDKDINGGTRRILDYLLSKLGFENYICVQQKEISEELGIKKTNVSASIKLLLQKGIIFPGPKLGRTTSYRLNEHYGYRGKLENLKKELMRQTDNVIPFGEFVKRTK